MCVNVGCKLRPLLECLFATIIMYHNEVVAQYGSLHVIPKAVIRWIVTRSGTARRPGIPGTTTAVGIVMAWISG